MVAHDEEAHALLEEHELHSEDTSVRDGGTSPSTYPALPSHLFKRFKRLCTVRWIVALIVVSALSVFGAIITSYGAREQFSKNGQDTPLAYRLHAQEHTSRPPTTLVFTWNVTAGLRSPDGVEKRVYLINGKYRKIRKVTLI
jgi:hypothetical protein